MNIDSENSSQTTPPLTRAVRVLISGARSFGIFADEIENIVDWRTPTPLPNAPAGILGVVCVRGRMLTLVDSSSLLETGAKTNGKIVTLFGDEQVGLAVEQAGALVDAGLAELQSSNGNDALTLGEILVAGQSIPILNSKQLFATAMRGRERRKRQF